MAEIEIMSLGNFETLEYGIDQFKNVYKRLIGKVSWDCIFEYRRLPKIRARNSKEMSLIVVIGIFSFAKDCEGKFWKKIKTQAWTEFMDGKDKPKYYMDKIIATKGNHYWTQQKKNKTIFKHTVDINNMTHLKRSKEYYNFIQCNRKQRLTQIESKNYEKAYLNRKKAREELYKSFCIKEKN